MSAESAAPSRFLLVQSIAGQRRLLNINGRWELDAPQPRAYYERLMMERYGIVPGRPADSPADEETEVQPSERFRQRYGLPPPEE